MTKPDDTIRVLIPLKVRKKNGRPKILPPADYRPSEDQAQDPHILRAIVRAKCHVSHTAGDGAISAPSPRVGSGRGAVRKKGGVLLIPFLLEVAG